MFALMIILALVAITIAVLPLVVALRLETREQRVSTR